MRQQGFGRDLAPAALAARRLATNEGRRGRRPTRARKVFLLLSGPTPLLPASKINGRRLHGGWAFLIVTAATGIWGT